MSPNVDSVHVAARHWEEGNAAENIAELRGSGLTVVL